MIRITLKQGYILTDNQGRVVEHDNGSGYGVYRCEAHDDWRITGIATRYNAHRVVSLEAAAQGQSIGQGWIRDYDHGTHRQWCMPTCARATRVHFVL